MGSPDAMDQSVLLAAFWDELEKIAVDMTPGYESSFERSRGVGTRQKPPKKSARTLRDFSRRAQFKPLKRTAKARRGLISRFLSYFM